MGLLLLIPSPGLRPERSPCPAGRPRAEHPCRQAGPAAGLPGRSPAARSRPARRRPPPAVPAGGEAVRRREGRAERPAGPEHGVTPGRPGRGGATHPHPDRRGWWRRAAWRDAGARRGHPSAPGSAATERRARGGSRCSSRSSRPGSPPPPPPPRAPEPARRAQHAGKPGPAPPPPGGPTAPGSGPIRPAALRRGAQGEPRPGRAPRGERPSGRARGPDCGGRPPGSLCCCLTEASTFLPHARPAQWKSGLGSFIWFYFHKSGSCPDTPALSGKCSELRRAVLVFSLLMPSCF